MTTYERLAEKIKNDIGIELVNFKRCRPGYWQRSQGAWSWVAQSGVWDYGSCWPASDLLKSNKLVINDREIFPD